MRYVLRNSLNISLYIYAFAILSSCGPKIGFQVEPVTEDSGFNGNLNTQARNKDGKLYTGFSPATAFLEMKEKIEPTPENQKLAGNIEGVHTEVKDKNLSVQIQWAGLEKPLDFHGPLQPEKDGKISAAGMLDQSQQKSDLKVSASCENENCEVLNAFLQNDKGQKIAFIVRTEKRVLKIKVPESQKKNIELLSPDKQSLIHKTEFGAPVKVTSTEIFPGKSTFEISMEGAQKSLIKGDLLATNDGYSKVLTDGEFSKLGSGEMVGNSNEGELTFKFSQEASAALSAEAAEAVPAGGVKTAKNGAKEASMASSQKTEAVAYVVLEGRTPDPKVDTAAAVESKSMHPILRQILADRDRPEVKAFIAKRIISHTTDNQGKPTVKYGSYFGSVRKYVGCHQGNEKICGPDHRDGDRIKNVKKMVQFLGQDNLPAAMTMVSMAESEFTSYARSPVGAIGWWQFMPKTARGYGLKVNPDQGVDERTNLEKSTHAASRLLKELLVRWHGDLKMSLASYNMGEEGLRALCKRKGIGKDCSAASEKTKFADMSDLLEIANKDFWKFYRGNSMPKETQSYVLKFLTGNLVALSPQDYGFANTPMPLN